MSAEAPAVVLTRVERRARQGRLAEAREGTEGDRVEAAARKAVA